MIPKQNFKTPLTPNTTDTAYVEISSKKMKDRRLMYGVIALSIFVFIGLYVLEFPYFSNLFNAEQFVFLALGAGAIAGMFIARHYSKEIKDQVDKIQIFVMAILLCALAMPLLLSLSNRLLAFEGTHLETVEYLSEEAYSSSRYGSMGIGKIDGYFVYFIRNGKQERIKVKTPHFDNIPKRQKVEIPVKKGLLAFDLVAF